MSYKTFQRRCKAETPNLIKTDKFMFYVTDKIDFTGEDYIKPESYVIASFNAEYVYARNLVRLADISRLSSPKSLTYLVK